MDKFIEVNESIEDVFKEIKRAFNKYKPMNSAHEGYAILIEEVDELWDEVRVKDSVRDKQKMRAEAMQVAAMAIRFMVDVCGDDALGIHCADISRRRA